MGYSCFAICLCVLFPGLVRRRIAVVDFGIAGGNEYGQCGEEEKKDDSGRALRRDIVIPQRCTPKLSVRQVI